MTNIEELTALVEAQNKRTSKAVIRTAIIYVVLLILVIGYTTYLMNSIKEAATPEAVSGIVIDKIEAYLPTAAEQLSTSAEPLAKLTADKSYEAISGLIPEASKQIRVLISNQTKKIVTDLKDQLVPAMIVSANQSLDRLLGNPDFNVATAGKDISQQICAETDHQLAEIIGTDFYAGIKDLRGKIQKLSQPNDKLTRSEYSEKMCLICWLYLNKNQDFSECENPVCKTVNVINETLKEAGLKLQEINE